MEQTDLRCESCEICPAPTGEPLACGRSKDSPSAIAAQRARASQAGIVVGQPLLPAHRLGDSCGIPLETVGLRSCGRTETRSPASSSARLRLLSCPLAAPSAKLEERGSPGPKD